MKMKFRQLLRMALHEQRGVALCIKASVLEGLLAQLCGLRMGAGFCFVFKLVEDKAIGKGEEKVAKGSSSYKSLVVTVNNCNIRSDQDSAGLRTCEEVMMAVGSKEVFCYSHESWECLWKCIMKSVGLQSLEHIPFFDLGFLCTEVPSNTLIMIASWNMDLRS